MGGLFFIGNSVFFVLKLHNIIIETINNNVSNINYLNYDFEAKYSITFLGSSLINISSFQ